MKWTSEESMWIGRIDGSACWYQITIAYDGKFVVRGNTTSSTLKLHEAETLQSAKDFCESLESLVTPTPNIVSEESHTQTPVGLDAWFGKTNTNESTQ